MSCLVLNFKFFKGFLMNVFILLLCFFKCLKLLKCPTLYENFGIVITFPSVMKIKQIIFQSKISLALWQMKDITQICHLTPTRGQLDQK